ncbi:MAG: CBS domain-containing protein [Rubrivivax sp.]
MNQPATLPTHALEPRVAIAQASPWHSAPVTLESPANDVMTDLSKVRAATTRPDASLHEAEQTMIFQGVRMLFVVSGTASIDGLITSTDLLGEKPMRIVQQRGVHHNELCVADVMTPRELLHAIDFARLASARVGQVVATLKKFGRNHLLVVERASAQAPSRIRGVISRSQIERQLGSAIVITPIAHTFSEIEQALL